MKTNTEAAAELWKALHAFGAQSRASLLTRSFKINDNKTYVLSVNLESLPHKRCLSESGMDILSTNTYFIFQYPQQAQNYNIEALARYDGILIIQGGLASVEL